MKKYFLFLLIILSSSFLNAMEVDELDNRNELSQIVISPALFGLSKPDENYLNSLRNLAQLFYYGHEWLKAVQGLLALEEQQNQLNVRSTVSFWNKMGLLDQSPQATFMPNEGHEFYSRLDEIKETVKAGTDHPFVLRRPGMSIPLFAASVEGMSLLLKHRSLFFNDTFTNREIEQIDNIYTEGIKSVNGEVVNLVTTLKNLSDRYTQSQARENLLNLQKEYLDKANICGTIFVNENPKVTLKEIKGLCSLCQQVPPYLLQSGRIIIKNIKLEWLIRNFESSFNITNLYENIRNELSKLIFKNRQRVPLVVQYKYTKFNEELPMHLSPPFGDSQDTSLKNLTDVSLIEKKPVSPKKKAPKKGKLKKKKTKVKSKAKVANANLNCSLVAPIIAQAAKISLESDKANLSLNQNIAQDDIEKGEEKELRGSLYEPAIIDLSSIPYDDGVLIRDDSSDKVSIIDSCNRMQIVLLATDAADKRFTSKVVFKENIQRWFKDLSTALDNQKPHPQDNQFMTLLEKNNHKIRIHRFSRLVDRYIKSRGVISQQKDSRGLDAEDKTIVIPGKVKFEEEQDSRSCYFVYCVDKNSRCFHRNIEFKLPSVMATQFMSKGFFEVEFPPLN